MKGKKGIELSVNFIVTFILAVVLFGMGIIFARMIMGGGTELTEETYLRFDQQIGELVCSRGESICLSSNNKEIERGKVDVFPITIKNALGGQKTATFTISVQVKRAFYRDDPTTEIPSNELQDYISLLYNMDDFFLDPGESDTIPILVKPEKNAPAGKYSFDVRVTADGSPYPDNKPRKFYVDVK